MKPLRDIIKKSVFGIVAVALSCVVSYAAAEMLVRWLMPQVIGRSQFCVDPQLGVIPFPGVSGYKLAPGGTRHDFTHNSRGLRAFKEYEEKRIAKYRILMLGDSYTYGLSVNDNETFSYYLQQNFDKENVPVEVINGGNPGKGTDYAVRFFQVLGHSWYPDLTIVWFYHNDFCDNGRGDYYSVDAQGQIHEKPPFATSVDKLRNTAFYNWLFSWSHLANFFKRGVIRAWSILRPNKRLYAAMAIRYPKGCLSEHYKDLTSLFIATLHNAVKANGGELLFCYIPDEPELASYVRSGKVSDFESAATQIIKGKGLALISLTQIFSQRPHDYGRLYLTEDGHFSPYGNALIGRYMAEYLKQSVLKR